MEGGNRSIKDAYLSDLYPQPPPQILLLCGPENRNCDGPTQASSGLGNCGYIFAYKLNCFDLKDSRCVNILENPIRKSKNHGQSVSKYDQDHQAQEKCLLPRFSASTQVSCFHLKLRMLFLFEHSCFLRAEVETGNVFKTRHTITTVVQL